VGHLEVFVVEFLAINRLAASAVEAREVSALEVQYSHTRQHKNKNSNKARYNQIVNFTKNSAKHLLSTAKIGAKDYNINIILVVNEIYVVAINFYGFSNR